MRSDSPLSVLDHGQARKSAIADDIRERALKADPIEISNIPCSRLELGERRTAEEVRRRRDRLATRTNRQAEALSLTLERSRHYDCDPAEQPCFVQCVNSPYPWVSGAVRLSQISLVCQNMSADSRRPAKYACWMRPFNDSKLRKNRRNTLPIRHTWPASLIQVDFAILEPGPFVSNWRSTSHRPQIFFRYVVHCSHRQVFVSTHVLAKPA